MSPNPMAMMGGAPSPPGYGMPPSAGAFPPVAPAQGDPSALLMMLLQLLGGGGMPAGMMMPMQPGAGVPGLPPGGMQPPAGGPPMY